MTKRILYNTKRVLNQWLNTEHVVVKWLLSNEINYYVNKTTKEVYGYVMANMSFEGKKELKIHELNKAIRELFPDLYIKVKAINKKADQVWAIKEKNNE